MKLSAILVSVLLMVTTRAVSALDHAYGQVPPICGHNNNPTITGLLSNISLPTNTTEPFLVPCNHHLVVDSYTTAVFPSGIVVHGHLSFADGGAISISTSYILVRGLLTIGSPSAPHLSPLRIELINGKADLVIPNENPFTRFQTTLNFGPKAFAVYGGSVQIHGSRPQIHFTHLSRSALIGDSSITVSTHVANAWKQGDVLGVAASSLSSYGSEQSSTVAVNAIEDHANGTSTIFLSHPLSHYHQVRRVELSDSTGRVAILAPEVSLISRNVVVSGMPTQTNLDDWLSNGTASPLGGHFKVSFSGERQIIQGVEFAAMGQAGLIGRYPIHIHFGANAVEGSHISANSVHHSQQRCVVLHATHHMLVKDNVAFRTAGHCYMTEDGIERFNTFERNIGIDIRRAIRLIPSMERDRNSDNRPAVFWMTGAQNHMLRNVAAGSPSFGFWFQLFRNVRGSSRNSKLPGWSDIKLQREDFGLFVNNVAHSVGIALSTYPEGSFPEEKAKFDGLFAWTVNTGFSTIVGTNQMLRNAVLVDVLERGFDSRNVQGHVLENVTVVGELPSERGCRKPLGDPVEAIHLEGDVNFVNVFQGLGGIQLKNVHIQGFGRSRSCRDSAGIRMVVDDESGWFPSSTVMDGVSFDDVDRNFVLERKVEKSHELGFMVKNSLGMDGSGYVVEKDSIHSPKWLEGCTEMSADMSGMAFCKDMCFRHVVMSFGNSGVTRGEEVKVQLIRRDGHGSVVVASEKSLGRDVENEGWMVSKLLPAGVYDVKLLHRNGTAMPAEDYWMGDLYFYRPDERRDPPGCDESVSLFVHGQYLFEAS